MHKLIELFATGALYTFTPLLLLLAVDLICWSVPMVWKGVSEEMQFAHAKRGTGASTPL